MEDIIQLSRLDEGGVGLQRESVDLLQLAQMPLLGSDCHNLTSRPPNLKGGRAVIRRKLGEDFLNQMDENAALAVQRWEWSR